jgi:glutathione-specific gamma-glutamylcyclotransferase
MQERLTRELIASAFSGKPTDEEGTMPFLSEEEIAASRAASFANLGPTEDVWLFGYGSLMWKPDMDFVERRIARLLGWHRRFCLWQWRYRGSKSKPALMMALDRGGSCVGIVFRIAAPDVSLKLAKVWQREMTGKGYRPQWVRVQAEGRVLKAITFVADRKSYRYAGRIKESLIAEHIAAACGPTGPNAEYLLETLLHCQEIGIRDLMLSRLEVLVARKMIEQMANADDR